MPIIRRGNPHEDAVRVAEAIGANGLVVGSHRTRALCELGGTAQAICERQLVW